MQCIHPLSAKNPEITCSMRAVRGVIKTLKKALNVPKKLQRKRVSAKKLNRKERE
jgi:hypothetical protein